VTKFSQRSMDDEQLIESAAKSKGKSRLRNRASRRHSPPDDFATWVKHFSVFIPMPMS
jgi:hypothetical protein